MIIAEIIGGLGNQLFEYANAKALSLKLNQEVYFDLSFFDRYHRNDVYRLDKFNTNIPIATTNDIYRLKRHEKKPDIYRKISRKLGLSQYSNWKYHFDNSWFEKNNLSKLISLKNMYVSGYYGDERYFMEIKEIIRKEFTLKNSLNTENTKVLSHIENSNSVSIHVRRGDYINNPYFAEIPLDYYRRAINYIETYQPNSSYFIFSDDLNWVKENLKPEQKTVFVDINDAATDYMELTLMASCKHNIIANSTFSWWAGWLNKNKNKIVIAPKTWYDNKKAQYSYDKGNLIPNSWIKL